MGFFSRRKIQVLIILAICLAVIAITIAYAYRNNRQLYNTWDIHFEDLSASSVGTAQYTLPKFSHTILTNYTVSVDNPGDGATFQFKVVNDGNLPARLSSIIKSIPRCSGTSSREAEEVCNQLVYTILKEDGTELKEGELLSPYSSQLVKVKVSYPDEGTKSLKNTIQVQNLDVDLLYREN